MQQNAAIKEYLDILFRRKWWIVIPTAVGLLFSGALFIKFPKLYKATTRVTIRGQRISPNVLASIIDSHSEELVTQINAEITSERYIQQLNSRLSLVGTPGGPKDLAELAKEIDNKKTLETNTRQRYFDLTIEWGSPRLAAEIANQLAAIYIEANKEVRAGIANETLAKLKGHREDVQSKLDEISAQIERFKGEHKFELGSYESSNLNQISLLKTEIERIDTAIGEHKRKISEIDTRLLFPVGTPEGTTAGDPRVARLEELRRNLAAERAKGRTENYPSVKQLLTQIKSLSEELGVSTEVNDEAPSQAQFQQKMLENDKKNEQQAIDALDARRAKISGDIEQIQARLTRTPDWQIQLEKLETQQKALQNEYNEARDKELKAFQGTQVEEYETGEQLLVLNKATPPRSPFWPDLKVFLLMGLALGGGLGVSMVLLLEVFDQSFKSEEQLAASIDLPILAVIPDLTRANELKKGGRGGRGQREQASA